MSRMALLPDDHSRPIGKYSPGICIQVSQSTRLVFVSGQVATDAGGQVLAPGDPGAQAGIVFERIAAVLEVAGGTLANVVNLCIYLRDIRQFDEVSVVRNRVLGEPAPASTLVEVSKLAEPGCLVEISAIAVVERSTE